MVLDPLLDVLDGAEDDMLVELEEVRVAMLIVVLRVMDAPVPLAPDAPEEAVAEVVEFELGVAEAVVLEALEFPDEPPTMPPPIEPDDEDGEEEEVVDEPAADDEEPPEREKRPV